MRGQNFGNLTKKEEAMEMLLKEWSFVPETEEVSLLEADGRTLAEDLFAKYNQPVVRSSAMDGIAVKGADFINGKPDTTAWKLGVDYVRADTGDDFEDEFDTVIAIENVTFTENGGVILAEDLEVKPGMCVNPAGSNIKAGTLVGDKGRRLIPQDLAAIAMGGYDRVKVYKKPKIAFIPTGSELVPAGSELKRGQNFDSNSIMVYSLLTEMGAEVKLHPIVIDDIDGIRDALEEVIPEADFIILNAGTSKGGEDFCVQYLEQRGKMLFHGVAAVPGRPMSITIVDEKPVVNMSGPAVAAFYSCNWLMRAVIDKMLLRTTPQIARPVEVTLTEEVKNPPVFSAMSSYKLEEAEDGTLLATPIALKGPKGQGAAAVFRADAYYASQIREETHQAGDKIKVYLR